MNCGCEKKSGARSWKAIQATNFNPHTPTQVGLEVFNRFAFASPIIRDMVIGGHDREVDYERLGQTLALAASMIFAIRNARRDTNHDVSLSNRDVEAEQEYAVQMAKDIVCRAAGRHPNLFPGKMVPWHQPTDDDVPK